MTGKLRRFGRDRSGPAESEGQDEAPAPTGETPSENSSETGTDTSAPAGDPVEEPTGDSADAHDDGTDTGAAQDGTAEPVEPSETASASVPDASTTRARTTRRATPAASAASRARRIGGVRTGAGAAASAATTSATEGAADTTTRSRVSTTKTERTAAAARGTAGRTASAKALRDEARGSTTGGVTVVTQVPGWLRWVPGVVLVACAVAMAVILAVSSHGVWWATPSAQKTRDQVLAAAKQCTALTNTYAWNTIPADEKRGKACTTGAQSQRYVSAMENIVKPTAPKLHASQTVQVNTAGIESMTPNGAQWTVVLFGQTTIRQKGASARVDPFSTVVRMDHVHGKWLISSICLITAPNGSQAANC